MIDEAVAAVRKKTDATPQVGIILGTGLDAIAAEIQSPQHIRYADIPGFPSHMVTTHKAEYVFGAIGGKSVCAMAGRFHKYQGYSMHEITLPVWVMIKLGIKVLVVSNACGGMREDHHGGDLFIITDHINLLGGNPLSGLDDCVFGNMFVDMLDPYDPELASLTEKIAKAEGLKPKKGVYAALEGPSLETRAEYAFLRTIGADVVGMSTVPEVIVARKNGVRCLGVACITDRCVPADLKPVDIAHIIKTAQEAEPKITRVVKLAIEKMKI
jgi:purine-nucleoside phosphorylase